MSKDAKTFVMDPSKELCPVHHVSHAASLVCEDFFQPLNQLDPHDLEGNWALVAEGVKLIQSNIPSQLSDSTSIYFSN